MSLVGLTTGLLEIQLGVHTLQIIASVTPASSHIIIVIVELLLGLVRIAPQAHYEVS